ANGPLAARRGGDDGLDDAFGGTYFVGGLRDFEAAFGMNNDADAGMLFAHAIDVFRQKALMDGAVALPQNHFGVAQRFRGVTAEFLVRIPDDHFAERDAHAIAGVATQVLVWQEEDFFAAG